MRDKGLIPDASGDEARAIIAGLGDQGQRLDVVLARHAGLTRSAATRLIDAARCLVDGHVRKPAFTIQAGMRIQWTPLPAVVSRLVPCEIPLRILYEDAAIVVIDKPAGLVVHPGAGNREGTLVHALIARYPDLAGVGSAERPGIVHRLDKLTSGVMVVARTQTAYYALAEAFKAHAHTRVYLCLCYGHMPASSGRIATLLNRHPVDRTRMSSKVKAGREAVTNWEVVREWPGFSLLRLTLETGRTHQIRVHLSDLGHPIVGDAEYGGRKRAHSIKDPALRKDILSVERQMLHAHILGLKHPATGVGLEFTSDLPADMQALVAVLDGHSPEVPSS